MQSTCTGLQHQLGSSRLTLMLHLLTTTFLLAMLLMLLPVQCLRADDQEIKSAGTPEEDVNAAPADSQSDDKDGPKAPRCVVTGLPWLKSSTRVEAIFRVDGQRLRGRFISLPYMLIQYKLLQEEGSTVSIESISVLDFASFGSGHERLVPLDDEWSNIVFISTNSSLAGSKEPYYAAFTNEQDVKRFEEQLGGKVLSVSSVMKRILQALSDEDENKVVESIEDSMRRRYRNEPD